MEEACNIFPNSHEAFYLKSRLFLVRANKECNSSLASRYRSEAKSCLLAARSIWPSHLPSLQYLAAVYHAEGNLVLAEKMLRFVVMLSSINGVVFIVI